MKIIHLGNAWGLLFFLFPLLCLFSVLGSRFYLKKGVKISGVSGFDRKGSIKPIGYYFSLLLFLGGLFIISFSLCKPQYVVKNSRIISKGIDIMLALDVSPSMLYDKDAAQSRIELAKKIIIDFIKKRDGDRIGLVTFARTSLLKCPATINHDLLQKIIKKIEIDPLTKTTTSIGLGLASAVNRLIHLKDNQRVESKIVILVTDGRNNSGEIMPETAADIALKMGIKVYTIGIGKSDEIDIALLQDIAQKTRGRFYQTQRSKDLGRIFDEIDQIEKVKMETVQFNRFDNIGYLFAYIGIIIALLGLLLNTLFFKRFG